MNISNMDNDYTYGVFDVLLKYVDDFGNSKHWFYVRSVLTSECGWSFEECDRLERSRNFPVKVATFCSLEKALRIRDVFASYGDVAEIISSTGATNGIGNGNYNSISLNGASIFDEDGEAFDVQLRTYKTPFTLDAYDSTGQISNRYMITDISYFVESGNLIIDVEGRMVYQREDIHWSIDEIEWSIMPPDKIISSGTEYLNKLSVGEYFDFRIEELIFESGTYVFKMKMC